MKASLLLFLFLCGPIFIHGQTLKALGSFEIGYVPVTASIDRQGTLYFASKEGAIDKFDQNGKALFHFSPQKKGKPSTIEAWQGLRTFVHYNNFQEYRFLDRFLNSSERYPIDFSSQNNNFSGLATLSGDNNLWLINDRELSLIKVDINSNEVLLENKLNLSLNFEDFNIQFIRAYQNYLFIGDAIHGILMFDNLGNFVTHLVQQEGIEFFSFNKNELIYIDGQKIRLTEIYSKAKREISLPDLPYQFVLMENNKIFLLHNQTVDIFSIN